MEPSSPVVAPKPWWQSRTMLVALITVGVGVIAELGSLPSLSAYAGEFAMAIGILNVILRTVTTQPLTNSPVVPTEPTAPVSPDL